MDKSSTEQKSEKTHRVFFAIIPDNQAMEEICALQTTEKNPKARFIKRENMHLTVLFLGNLNQPQLDCMIAATQQIQQKKMRLKFDKTGVFKKARIWWLGQNDLDDNLLSLYEVLKLKAIECELIVEKRKFKPHFTLARKYNNPHFTQPEHPIHLSVADFHLLESIPTDKGVRYEILKTCPLM